MINAVIKIIEKLKISVMFLQMHFVLVENVAMQEDHMDMQEETRNHIFDLQI